MTQHEDFWPPKSTLPEPISEYDDLLTKILTVQSENPPTSRLALIAALHAETRMPLQDCRIYVDSYCNRYSILFRPTQTLQFAVLVPALISLAIMLSTLIIVLVLHTRHDAAHTRTQRIAINQLAEQYCLMAIVLLFSNFVLMLWLVRRRRFALKSKAGQPDRKN